LVFPPGDNNYPPAKKKKGGEKPLVEKKKPPFITKGDPFYKSTQKASRKSPPVRLRKSVLRGRKPESGNK